MRTLLLTFKTPILIIMLFFMCNLYAQLPSFNLQLTTVAQTCLGNGSINFTVTGTAPSATVAYQVFLLPNTIVPVAAVSGNSAGNLVAGNYMVVAIQTLGGQSNTTSANVTVASQVVPLTYTVATGQVCGGNGAITVNVTSGTAVSYEITSGPVTVPQQASNIFTGLPGGQYVVRVYDNCGDAVVLTVQVSPVPAIIDVSPGMVVGNPSCESVPVRHDYMPLNGSPICWPLTFTYTIYPPEGAAPVTITSAVAGDIPSNGVFTITTDVPFYPQAYFYNLVVTDAPGNVFNASTTNLNFTVNCGIDGNLDPCFPESIYLYNLENIMFPVTITFLESPAGFDPVEYNSNHPTFNQQSSIFYQKQGYLLPSGNYTMQMVDACGRVYVRSKYMTETNDAFYFEEFPGECGFGGVKICTANQEVIVKEIVAGPLSFSETYPVDITDYLPFSNGDMALSHLPEGDYTIHIITGCGNDSTFDYHITSNPIQVTVFQAPGCINDYGSVVMTVANNHLDNVTITDAPEEFSGELPLDVSGNIDLYGMFYMNSLPQGNYTVTSTSEECPNPITTNFSVTGYYVALDDVNVIRNCGSFDLELQQVANNGFMTTFWLQHYNQDSGTWGHPDTGVPYAENTEPSDINSLPLTTESINYGLAYTGQFRVIRAFGVFGNGFNFSTCLAVIDEFTYEDGPVITGAYSFPCDDGTADVVIVAEGLPPLYYGITSKNGQPFAINNATSALFTDLEPAIYNFMVTDVCGNIRNIIFDINTLQPMDIVAQGFCDGQKSVLTVPDFTFLVYEWYRLGDPEIILSTTHTLDFPAFDPESDPGTFAVHIQATAPGSCIDLIVEHVIVPGGQPNAGNDNNIYLCHTGDSINLENYLTAPHDGGGIWESENSTAVLNGSMLDTSTMVPGNYVFIYSVRLQCGSEDSAEITLQLGAGPGIPVVSPISPVCTGGDVYLSVDTMPGAIYEWTGPGGFISSEQNPVVTNATLANAGEYFVTVTANGCKSVAVNVNVVVNEVPEFTIEGNAILCEGQSTVLSVIPLNFDGNSVAYVWRKDGELLPDIEVGSVEIFEAGIYEVGVNSDSCNSRVEKEVSINNNAFSVEPKAGCVDGNFVIGVANSDALAGAVFQWHGPAGYSSLSETADISGLAGGEYRVTVINAEGCTVEASVEVNTTLCSMPKGLSPNSDGINDSFDLSSFEVDNLIVFNRHGIQVYEKENYKDEWYGQSDKGELPTGTYYYVVTLSEGKQVTGWVYVQREVN